jgi:hypothetical protein
LLIILAVSCALRALELHTLDFRTYLALLPDQEFFGAPWWRLLLPFNVGDSFYAWTATGLVLTTLLDLSLGTKPAFLLLNSVLIVTSYVTSWCAFRSRTFSLTLALLMGVGSQLTYAYVISSLVKYFLFLSYLQINLLFLLLILRSEFQPAPQGGTPNRWLLVGFGVSLVASALCSELWLDYCLFLFTVLAYVGVHFYRTRALTWNRPAASLALTTTSVLVAYLLVRMLYIREHLTYGKEGEVILMYLFPLEDGSVRFAPANAALALEDLVSNVFTYLHLAFSNFFPPPLLASNSLVFLGKDRILAEQYGYHAAQAHLVFYHHLFYWYFAAGVVAAAFFAALALSIRRDWQNGSLRCVPILTTFLLLILCGFFTHSMIKFRPYLSSPVFTYKAIVSVLGVAWLIAYGMMRLRSSASRGKFKIAAMGVVLVLLSNAFARPPVLTKLSQAVGMGAFPNPAQNLERLLRQR